MSRRRYRWLFVLLVAIAVSTGTMNYITNVQPMNKGDLSLQRLGLLYLNEPAPALDKLGVETLPAVIVFCKSCQLPEGIDAGIVKSDDASIAELYGLKGADDSVGPGYAVVDKEGQVRYRTYDNELHKHANEINIIVRGVK